MTDRYSQFIFNSFILNIPSDVWTFFSTLFPSFLLSSYPLSLSFFFFPNFLLSLSLLLSTPFFPSVSHHPSFRFFPPFFLFLPSSHIYSSLISTYSFLTPTYSSVPSFLFFPPSFLFFPSPHSILPSLLPIILPTSLLVIYPLNGFYQTLASYTRFTSKKVYKNTVIRLRG